jgi:hypothetical protein
LERDIVARYVEQKSCAPKPVKAIQSVVTRKWRSRNPDLSLRLIELALGLFSLKVVLAPGAVLFPYADRAESGIILDDFIDFALFLTSMIHPK